MSANPIILDRGARETRENDRRPAGTPPRRRLAAGLAIACLVALAGCEREPARIDHAALPDPILDRSMHPLQAMVVNSKGERLKGKNVKYALEPATVAEVSTDGRVLCRTSGDATLTLTGGGLTTGIPVRCRIPSMIRMPDAMRLVAGAAATPIKAEVVGEGGAPLADLAAPIVSSDPAIAEVASGSVRPVAFGRTLLRAVLGDIVGVTPVEVVTRIASGPIALKDGAVHRVPVEPGTYELTVEVKAGVRVAQGVTVAWEGSACPARPEAESHRDTCTLRSRGTLVIANPATMGVGVPVGGTLTLDRVPPAS
jgi:hypothetical protein